MSEGTVITFTIPAARKWVDDELTRPNNGKPPVYTQVIHPSEATLSLWESTPAPEFLPHDNKFKRNKMWHCLSVKERYTIWANEYTPNIGVSIN